MLDNKKIELGDFQTNINFCDLICKYLKNKGINPEILIEPTCGKGNFILSAIKYFPNIKEIYAIEINENYLQNLNDIKNKLNLNVNIFNDNIFDFNLKKNQR